MGPELGARQLPWEDLACGDLAWAAMAVSVYAERPRPVVPAGPRDGGQRCAGGCPAA
jgi:hypothetical protein